MKFATLFPAALIALMLTVSASAQQGLEHPTEQGAQLVGTYPVSLNLPKVETKKGTDVVTNILVWATGNGQKELQMNPAIQVTGDSGSSIIDLLPTSALYGMLSQAAVSKAVALGYIQPSTEGQNVPVYRPNYAARTGSGNSTQFAMCGDGSWGVANYNVLFPVAGTVVVNLDDTEFQTEFVNGNCQSTFTEPVQSSTSGSTISSGSSIISGHAALAKSAKLDRIRERIRARHAAAR
ncbi:MAG: hypothetical protein DYG96_04735 [Chlorobi bacterium CHB2]|nr:hypothetical protein [Chlorobi bacterium CHB2]